VSNFCAPFRGHLFGLGVITVSALACSGSVFKGAPPDPDEIDTTDSELSRAQPSMLRSRASTRNMSERLPVRCA
jgi:hypothetical protein